MSDASLEPGDSSVTESPKSQEGLTEPAARTESDPGWVWVSQIDGLTPTRGLGSQEETRVLAVSGGRLSPPSAFASATQGRRDQTRGGARDSAQ